MRIVVKHDTKIGRTSKIGEDVNGKQYKRHWYKTYDADYNSSYNMLGTHYKPGVITIISIGSCLGVILFALACVFGGNQISRQLAVESCHNWSIQTGRQSKFISQNLMNYGCFTVANDGKWVSINNPTLFIPLKVSK